MSGIDLNRGGGFGLKEYVASFSTRPPENGSVFIRGKYFTEEGAADLYKQVSALAGDPDVPDTALEFAITSYYTATVNVRPVQAAELLPANSQTSELKLGAVTYMEMQMARFTGGDAAPYAAALRFITDRGNVSEADIKGFMAQGIAAEVDAQFNKVSFLLDKTAQISYNAVLTRDVNNQYILSYERPSVENDDKKLSAPTLQALLDAMRRNTADFSQTSIDQVRAQAALIPAVRLGRQPLENIKAIITSFYTSPNSGTYAAIRDVYIIYEVTKLRSGDYLFGIIRDSYYNTLDSLNTVLAQKVSADSGRQASITSLPTNVQQELVKLVE
jgi:hypothetical protein